MKINPMLKKELKLSIRTPRLPVIIVIFNFILTAFALGGIFFIKESSFWVGQIYFRYNIYMYIIIASIEFLLLIFIVPTISSGLISSEREKQTLDILLTSGLKPLQIISGKLMAAAGNILLIIVSGLPVLGITFIYGGIELKDIFITLLFLIFTVFYIGSLGILCSSILKKTTFSTLMTLGLEFLLIAGTFLIVYFGSVIQIIYSGYQTSSIGIISLLLLLSPAVTFVYLLMDQVASITNIDTWMQSLGMPEFIIEHFIAISIIVQSIFICIFIALAVYYLKERSK